MKRILPILLISFFLASCGSNPPKKTAAKVEVSENAKVALADKDSEERIICRQQKRLGSNRITKVCYTESEIEDATQSTQNEMQRHNYKTGTKVGN